jgi:hypothetical protein
MSRESKINPFDMPEDINECHEKNGNKFPCKKCKGTKKEKQTND